MAPSRKDLYMTSYLATAGYPVLALAVLIGALGAPLPLSAVLAAAAALARQGHLQLTALFVICVAAALVGDCLGYLIGRHGISRIPLAARLRVPGSRYFGRFPLGVGLFGSMALLIFVTRWAVTLPAPFVNVVAGARRYPWHRFVAVGLTGEALWVALSLAPGYLLGGIGPAGMIMAVSLCLVPLLIAGLVRTRMTPVVA